MRIAIVKISALGDIIHAMVALQFIKSFDKEFSVDWMVDKAYKELLDQCPDINQVHIIKLKECKKKKSLGLLLNEFKKLRKFF